MGCVAERDRILQACGCKVQEPGVCRFLVCFSKPVQREQLWPSNFGTASPKEAFARLGGGAASMKAASVQCKQLTKDEITCGREIRRHEAEGREGPCGGLGAPSPRIFRVARRTEIVLTRGDGLRVMRGCHKNNGCHALWTSSATHEVRKGPVFGHAAHQLATGQGACFTDRLGGDLCRELADERTSSLGESRPRFCATWLQFRKVGIGLRGLFDMCV